MARTHDPLMRRLVEVQEQMLLEMQGLRQNTNDGFRQVTDRLDQTNARLDQTNACLDNLIHRLERAVFPETRGS